MKLRFPLSPSPPHSPAGKHILGTKKPFSSTFSSQTLFLLLAPRTNSKQTGDTVNSQHCAVNPPFSSVSKHFCATSAVLHLRESHDFYGISPSPQSQGSPSAFGQATGDLFPPTMREVVFSETSEGSWTFTELVGFNLFPVQSLKQKWSL